MEEILINVGVSGQPVNQLSQDVDKFGTQIDQTTQSMTQMGQATQQTEQRQESLRSQIRRGREELAQMTKGTADYAAKLAEVASKQAIFNRINKELKASQTTIGQTMTNVNNVVGGLAGGFSVATGVISLFGIENENAMKSLIKMQALMSITSGLSSLNTAIRSWEGLTAVFGSLFKSSKDVVTSIESVATANTVATSTSNANIASNNQQAASNIGLTTSEANLATQQIITAGTTIGQVSAQQSLINLTALQTELNAAELLSVELLSAATFNDIQFTSESVIWLNKKYTAEQQAILTKEELTLAVKEHIAAVNAEILINRENIAQQEANSNKNLELINKEKTAKEGSNKIPSAAEGLLKSMGMLVVYAAVIYGVVAAISFLIKKLNEIPKELELELKLNESAIKELSKTRVTVAEIQHDLDIIANKHDKISQNQLENIKKVMIAQGIATSSEIDKLSAKELRESNYFKRYLKKVEDVAYDEALIKMKVDSQLKQDKAKADLISIEKSGKLTRPIIDTIQKMYLNEKPETIMGWLQKQGNDIISNQEAQKYLDTLRSLTQAKKEIEGLNKIKFKDTSFVVPNKEDTKSKESSISSQVSDFKTPIKDIEAYNKTFDIVTSQYIQTYKGINEEQSTIDRIRQEESTKFLTSSVKQQLLYNQQINNAKLQDLENNRSDLEKQKTILTENSQIRIQNSEDTLVLLKETFEKQLFRIKNHEDELNIINKGIYDNEVSITKKEIDLKNAKTESDKKRIQSDIDLLKKKNNLLKSEADKEVLTLTNLKKQADDLLKDKAKAEKDLTDAVASGANIDELQKKLDEINSQIIDNAAQASQITRDLWMASFDDISKGIEQVGKTLSGLSSISDSMMQVIDNKTNHEKNQLELSDEYQKASNEKQQKMMYDLDKKNYASKKKLFDLKKAFDIGVVAVEAASSEMGAVKNLIGNGGAISPVAWVAFAAETAMIAGTSIASIAEISSRQLDAPVPPNSSTGSSSSSTAVALNPQQTAMTSREENLNMMQSSNKQTISTFVKVSEINEVQNKVAVLESENRY